MGQHGTENEYKDKSDDSYETEREEREGFDRHVPMKTLDFLAKEVEKVHKSAWEVAKGTHKQ